MADSWNKKERLKKKQQQKKEKAEKMQERKESARNGNDLDTMLAYVDENGNISAVPPDPTRKKEIRAEDIEIGVVYNTANDTSTVKKGIVTNFNTSKGYGFIRDLKTGESIFFHVKSLTEEVKENNKVEFEVENGPKGLSAYNITVLK